MPSKILIHIPDYAVRSEVPNDELNDGKNTRQSAAP